MMQPSRPRWRRCGRPGPVGRLSGAALQIHGQRAGSAAGPHPCCYCVTVALVLAAIAKNKGEERAKKALAVAAGGFLLALLLAVVLA